MVKSYKTHSFVDGLRFSCVNAIKANKVKIFVTFVFVLIAIFTGVFIAVKANNAYELCNLREINLDGFYSGFAASSSAFFARSFSLVVNVLLLSVLTLSPFLFPLACVLFVYRGYLFGLNFALISETAMWPVTLSGIQKIALRIKSQINFFIYFYNFPSSGPGV